MSDPQTANFTLPNPLTPLAWLPSDVAGQYEASRYLLVASLSAFIWDIAVNVDLEWKMLTKFKISLPTVVYFLSRIGTAAYQTTSTVFQVGSVDDCQALQVALGWSYTASLTFSSALFLFRVRAVLERHKALCWFFTIFWIINAGVAIEVPFAITGAHIGTTSHCINTSVKSFVSATLVVSAVYDTAIYLAITWKLASISRLSDSTTSMSSIWSGKGLQGLSKAVLQSGQIYYLTTIGGNIVCMTLILTPSVPPIIRAMFTIPNNALMNSMATRVFRRVKFGMLAPNGMPVTMENSSLPVFRSRPPQTRYTTSGGNQETTFGYGLSSVDNGHRGLEPLRVKKDVVSFTDVSPLDIPMKTFDS